MSQDYKIEILSPEEAERVLKKLDRSQIGKPLQRTMIIPGFEIKGEFSLVARDAKSGEVEWEHYDENLITDLGRRFWMDNHFSNMKLGFSPDTRTPSPNRFTSTTDPTQCFVSGGIAPANTPATHTKTLIYNPAGTPASNRTLGMIAVLSNIATVLGTNMGLYTIAAYALLTPPRVQTTTQTLEVAYKISMNPIS
jgi:hypothetical protein